MTQAAVAPRSTGEPKGGGMVHRMLRVPLLYKLAGANLTIVLATWGAGYAAYHDSASKLRILLLISLALSVALSLNLLLVAIALRLAAGAAAR